MVALARERPEKFGVQPFSKGWQSPEAEPLVAPRRERNPLRGPRGNAASRESGSGRKRAVEKNDCSFCLVGESCVFARDLWFRSCLPLDTALQRCFPLERKRYYCAARRFYSGSIKDMTFYV